MLSELYSVWASLDIQLPQEISHRETARLLTLISVNSMENQAVIVPRFTWNVAISGLFAGEI